MSVQAHQLGVTSLLSGSLEVRALDAVEDSPSHFSIMETGRVRA